MKTYSIIIRNEGQDDLHLKMTEDEVKVLKKDSISINPIDGSMKMPRGETILINGEE